MNLQVKVAQRLDKYIDYNQYKKLRSDNSQENINKKMKRKVFYVW